jgi:hypothetical protein
MAASGRGTSVAQKLQAARVTTMTDFAVQAMTRDMLAGVSRLFQRAYGSPLDEAFYAWRFLDNPLGPTMAVVALDGERVVSHYAVCPAIIQAPAGRRVRCAQSMTTMTDPDYAGRGLFLMLADELYGRIANEPGIEIVFGFPNSNSHYAFVNKLGWSDVCPLFFMTRSTHGVPTDTPFEVSDWGEPASIPRARPVPGSVHQPYARTPEFIRWRYELNPENRYVLIAPGRASSQTCAVAKIYADEDDCSSLDIVDFLGDLTLESISGVVAASLGYAKSRSLMRVQGWVNLHHPAFAAFERFRFSPSGPITYFGIRPISRGSTVPCDPRSWWITMGDSDVF